MTTDGETVNAAIAAERDENTLSANTSSLRTVFNPAWSRIRKSIVRPFRDLHAMFSMLVRVDFTEVFGRARENYALWRNLADSAASEYPASVDLIRQRYRRFVAREAYWYLRHEQIMARTGVQAVAKGLAILLVSWMLILSGASNTSHFIWISVAVGITVVLFLAYFTVSQVVRVDRVAKTGKTMTAVGALIQVFAYLHNQRVVLDSDNGYLSISLILYGAFAWLMASAAEVEERNSIKIWFKKHPTEIGTVYSFQVASTLETQQLGLIGDAVLDVRWKLLTIATCLDNSVESRLDTVASQRSREAARRVRECTTWLLLQQPGTVDSIRDIVRSVAFAFLTGYYHCLPADPHWSPAVPKDIRRANAVRISRQIASAILPLAVVIVIALFSLPLPTLLGQWAVALAVVWFIVKIVLFIDPDFKKTWKDVREILSSRDSFTDQQGKVKGE